MLFDHIFHQMVVAKHILLLKVEHLRDFQEKPEAVMY